MASQNGNEVVESPGPYDALGPPQVYVYALTNGQTESLVCNSMGQSVASVLFNTGADRALQCFLGFNCSAQQISGPTNTAGSLAFATSGSAAGNFYFWAPDDLSLVSGTGTVTLVNPTSGTATWTSLVTGNQAVALYDLQGSNHTVLCFPSVSNGDTFNCAPGLIDFCLENNSGVSSASATWAAGVLTFNTSGTITNLRLHQWARG